MSVSAFPRLSRKLSSVGLPLSKYSEDKVHSSFVDFLVQQATALLYLECRFIRALAPESRREMFGLSNAREFTAKTLLPYFNVLNNNKELADSGLYSPSMTAKLMSDIGGRGCDDATEAHKAAILRLIEVAADVAIGFSALEVDASDQFLPAPLESRQLTSSSHANEVRTKDEKVLLENIMLKVIAVFGIPAPATSDPKFLQKLSRLAARCIFLAQRMTLCPKGFTMVDAKAALNRVPLFSEPSKDTTPTLLEQYTKGVRLLLTLETELLQRFATVVVDEAQSFTALCVFDPAGLKVGS